MPAGGRKQRLFDIVTSSVILLLVWPVLLAIILILLVFQGMPVIYREPRVGTGGRLFQIYKFRTMVPGANHASSVATSNDSRLTFLGRYLKPWRLDELPQLVNVLKGDLSLVGPRPLPPSHFESLPEKIRRRILAVSPGITSRVSIMFIAEDELLAGSSDPERVYLEFILPAKVAAQLEEPDSWSLWHDLQSLGHTFLAWSPAHWERSRHMIRSLLAAA